MAGLITAAIIARDEERHLGPCLDALAWADERLVLLDARTRDRSAEVTRSRGARVETREFTTFPAQRNAALNRVSTPWVIFVDADERATPSLAGEVQERITGSGPDGPVGYWIPRRNYIWGGWIRHGGWSPDHQLRLFKVDRVRYDEGRDVHELAVLDGPEDRLDEALIHYNYDRFDQFVAKQRAYCALDARRLVRAGYRPRPRNLVLQPVREFRRRYFTLEGRRDGWRGLVLSILLAGYSAATYVEMARQLRRGR